jgi:Rrf2 family protein
MQMTRASQYAIHALVYMASLKENQPVASHLVARAQGIPERFLLKVLMPLVRSRVLNSIKGPHGGYRLAKAPKDISLLEVLEAVDGVMSGQGAITPDGMDAGLNKRLEKVYASATEAVRQQFQKVKIADLVGKGK